jgi:hypothetical protein
MSSIYLDLKKIAVCLRRTKTYTFSFYYPITSKNSFAINYLQIPNPTIPWHWEFIGNQSVNQKKQPNYSVELQGFSQRDPCGGTLGPRPIKPNRVAPDLHQPVKSLFKISTHKLCLHYEATTTLKLLRTSFSVVVELQGFEPWTPALQRQCSSQLSYSPPSLKLRGAGPFRCLPLQTCSDFQRLRPRWACPPKLRLR